MKRVFKKTFAVVMAAMLAVSVCLADTYSILASATDTAVTTTTVGSATPTTTATKVATTTTTATKTTTTTATSAQSKVEYLDVAPVGLNSAQIYGGMTGASDVHANAMRNRILNYPDTLKNQSGKKYYVSQKKGSDLNDGTSPDKAWKTLSMVNSIPQSGDIVLFERGGAYRGQLIAKSGVFYGAYGNGQKPAIYGSKKNYATEKWTADSTRDNVYYYQGNLTDVGVVVINHGAIKSIRQKSVGSLTARAAVDGWYAVDGNRVYVVSKKGNPSDVYNSIEIGEDQLIVSVGNCKNVTFENLSIKYTGSHGMQGNNTENIVVRGCEFGWIGGSILGSSTTPYGNAIEWWSNCKSNTVEDSWIYQCYDTGWTFQSSTPVVVTGQKFINNLVEYCWYSTEAWIGGTADDLAQGKLAIEDIEISGNIMRFAGYCFGETFRPDKINASHHFSSSNTNNAKNYVVKNNIFERSRQTLFGWTDGMTFDGNTYIQTESSTAYSLTYGYACDDNAAQTISEVIGDKNGTFLYSGDSTAISHHIYTNNYDTACDICGKEREANGASGTDGVLSYAITPDENGGTATITKCDTAVVGEVVIPSTIDGATVKTIATTAFKSCKTMTSVVIPDTVTTIEKWAFYACSGLTSVTLPDSVTTIVDGAFENCRALTDVWYGGNSQDEITIGANNTYLQNAAWHYNTCVEHHYDGVCDADCNDCEWVREPATAHTYGGACDDTCNGCGNIRTVTVDHVYNNACDVDCNECGLIREVPDHVYDNACDVDCNECGVEREVPDHVYGHNCDADCNVCGETRIPYDHVYKNACDMDCNVCGAIRVPSDHVYSNGCDIDCNVCGATRTVNGHVYDNPCDADCNNCGVVREVSGHVYDNGCDGDCNNCGAVREEAGHVYDDYNDTDCNECGHVREKMPVFVVGNAAGRSEQTVQVIVSVANNPGIVSAKLNIDYDSTKLELVEYAQKDFTGMTFGPIENDPFAANWCDALNGNNTTDGVFVVLTFRVKADAEIGFTPITVSYDAEDVYDYNFENVTFDTDDGGVEINKYIPGDVNGDGAVNNKDVGLMQRYINGWGNEIDKLAADVTGDGAVNNKDVGILQRYINGWEIELA